MKSWSSITIGCRANQSDTMEVEKMLAGRGWNKVEWGDLCDLVLVNTCTVTARSDRQCRKTINRGARNNPGAVVAVTGCFAVMRGRYEGCPENVHMIPAQDVSGKVEEIVALVEKYRLNREGPNGVDSKVPNDLLSFGASRPPFKVQDGCADGCAFCTVCLARGEPRSMEVDKILKGLREFSESGVKEVVLTGINLGSWGKDLGIRGGVSTLLLSILPELPVERVRLSSLEPQHLDESLISLMKKWTERICPHLHLPLQSADDHILAAMRRSYNFDRYADFVKSAVREIEGISIGADVICGFPGETDLHFSNSYERIASLPLSYLHVFPFSSRPGTPAASMKGKVDAPQVLSRSRKMRELAAEKTRIFRESQMGKTRTALVEHRRCSQTGCLIGTTDNYLSARMVGNDDLMGELVLVRIEKVGETISGHMVKQDF